MHIKAIFGLKMFVTENSVHPSLFFLNILHPTCTEQAHPSNVKFWPMTQMFARN